jgi:hypothetical protein
MEQQTTDQQQVNQVKIDPKTIKEIKEIKEKAVKTGQIVTK